MLVDAAQCQDVIPSVPVEIIHKGKHAVRWAGGRIVEDGGIELVVFFKARALVPERSGHDITAAIPVEIPEMDAVTVILVRQHDLLPKQENWPSK